MSSADVVHFVVAAWKSPRAGHRHALLERLKTLSQSAVAGWEPQRIEGLREALDRLDKGISDPWDEAAVKRAMWLTDIYEWADRIRQQTGRPSLTERLREAFSSTELKVENNFAFATRPPGDG